MNATTTIATPASVRAPFVMVDELVRLEGVTLRVVQTLRSGDLVWFTATDDVSPFCRYIPVGRTQMVEIVGRVLRDAA